MPNWLLAPIATGVFLLAIYCAWRAAQGARTPAGAVAWVVFLLSAPYLGPIIYAFLGPHRFKARLERHRISRRLFDAQRPDPGPRHDVTDALTAPFVAIAELPVTEGNSLTILEDGDATFDAIHAAIDTAETYALVQFYILRDDQAGQALAERLIAAAGRGVRVRLCFDGFASRGMSRRFLAKLAEAGVEIAHRGRGRILSRFEINFRNHRKTVIVDGRLGFSGGLNVGDEYMGRDPAFGPWRDTHLQIEGPMVAQLQMLFAEDWHALTGCDIQEDLTWRRDPVPDGIAGLIVGTGPTSQPDSGGLMFFSAIAAARARVWIASPYCVPDTDVMSALKHAALQGKDVRLVVPDMIDHRMPWLAAFAYFDDLMDAGVQIWRYRDGFMHQKALVIDDCIGGVGTTNLDFRSFRLNFETMALGFDESFAGAVGQMLERDMARSFQLEKRLADQNWQIRLGAPAARLFAPLL